MHVFIDDSGDAGMKLGSGSSRFLVMAACVFKEPEDIERAVALIRGCSEQHRMRREFKYSKTRDGIRDSFFRSVEPARFAVRAIVIDKSLLTSRNLRENPSNLKSHAIYQLLTHHGGTIRDAKLVVDGQDCKPFGMSDNRYFRSNVNWKVPGTIRAVDFVDSTQSVPVQLADMTAGAIHRFVREDEKHNPAHFETFKRRTWRARGGSLWRFK